jgi:hypothetical protein
VAVSFSIRPELTRITTDRSTTPISVGRLGNDDDNLELCSDRSVWFWRIRKFFREEARPLESHRNRDILDSRMNGNMSDQKYLDSDKRTEARG